MADAIGSEVTLVLTLASSPAPVGEMTTEYRALLEHVPDRHVHDALSPFFRFLSAFDVGPADVSDGSLERYAAFRGQTRFKKVKNADLRRLARISNASLVAGDLA